ncbi:MAG: coproporphyrinogen dehydrogenase HemZ [Oscillospiraceae bacterium]|nr:coproporphyrinogen dehydrogenase HemZ [Candidatus Limimonas coprohippi]
MVLIVNGNDYAYELEKLTSSFYKEEAVKVIINGAMKDGTEPSSEMLSELPSVEIKTESNLDFTKITAIFKGADLTEIVETEEGSFIPCSLASSPDSLELHCAQLLFKVLCKATSTTPGFGLLTGIRPSKLLIRLMEEKGENEGVDYFKNCFFVSDKKTRLTLDVARAEESIMKSSTPDSFSLYISIPFCPSRCSYCSFVSSAVDTVTAKKAFGPYFENLLKEVEYTGELAKKAGIKMRSAYVGGGTPSTLSAEQIEKLLKTIRDSFDMSSCEEFTFEAGRPDTITRDKLEACFNASVDRISINPQTMSDEVLKLVGRKHTAQLCVDAYNMAREVGFKNINMDLIAGLPGDTLEGFKDSLMKVIALGPESITVHALAYKRSSDLDYSSGLFSESRNISAMVDFANDALYDASYIPYYMYRQAKSVGNLENVGWCKPGFESKYNIFMMEECHTILACGAGAVTKLKQPNGSNITRIFNFKYPFEYNDKFEEQINRKKAVLDFYG